MITFVPTVDDVEKVLNVLPYIIAVASAVVNLPFIPHPQEEKANKFLTSASKIVNFLALNFKTLKK